jgi:predicted lysophospholipase L1 biosynthesis ABC-type transport system permease subunit
MNLAWYEPSLGSSLTAWEAFTVTDVVLALVGVTALLFGAAAIMRPAAAFPVPGSSVVGGFGALGAVLVVIRLVNPPADLSVQPGAWLGLAACLGMVIGAYYGMQEEGLQSSPGG